MKPRRWMTCIAAAALGWMALPAPAATLELTGVARDFKRGDQSGGHKDFETAGAQNKFGHVINMVTFALGEDKLPVFNPTRPSSKDTMYSSDSFNQWYRDVPGINLSAPLKLVLDNHQKETGGVYTYSNSAFWPLDGQLYGNQGLNHNFHYTFELHTRFAYKPGQNFKFIGDDDVWVYVNGVKVLDLGGVHAAVTGNVILFDGKAFSYNASIQFTVGGPVKKVDSAMATSLAAKWSSAGLGSCPIKSGDRYFDLGLKENQNCLLDFFFAERHTVQSNFRIDTSMDLIEVPPTTISPLYD